MEEIIELTEALIRFRSTHANPVEITRCIDFLETYLKTHHIPYRRFDHNGVPALLAPPPGSRRPLLLMSHIDVVDAPDRLFTPVRKNGRLYGRGALDDKYAAALSLFLLKRAFAHPPSETETTPPLMILITGDEEIGGFNGAKKALAHVEADFCIALDGGGLDRIVVLEKGVLQLELTARGRAAHGARPWLGDNAVERLIDDYLALKKLFPPHNPPDHWHRTMTLSAFRAGNSPNQVPDTATARFDIRYTENDDVDALLTAIEKAVEGEVVVKLKEPVFTGGKSSYMNLLLQAAGTAAAGFEHGASDARFLSAHNIDGVVWGAEGNNTQHTLDEHVEIDSVFELCRRLEAFLHLLQNAPTTE